MSRAADLYRLQQLDDQEQQSRRRLAEIAEALGESPALRRAREKAQTALKQVQRQTVRQRDLELEVQGIKSEIAGAESRLYGGGIRNPKELGELQAKVASLRRLLDKKEEELLEVMIAREEAEAAHEQAQAHLEMVQETWREEQAQLQQEQARLEERLEAIQQRREKSVSVISAADLDIYQALRRTKDELAVTTLRAGACAACGMEVPPGRIERGREAGLLFCGNCERILVPETEVG